MTDLQNNTFGVIARLTRLALLSLLASTFTCVSSQVYAGTISGSYAVNIGESTRLLEAELQLTRGEISNVEFMAIQKEESCKNVYTRLHERNRPALLIQNTSVDENEISSFTINITELGYEFGNGDIGSDGFNGALVVRSIRTDAGVSVSASYGETSGATDRTKLNVLFSGLTEGKAAIFRLDLDAVPMVGDMYPDYRGILLGADLGLGATSPAMISATFENEEMQASTPFQPFSQEFDGRIETSGRLEAYHSQAPSQMYGQTGTTDNPTVPEPSTAVLLLAGAAGLMSWRSRRCALGC